jgi:ubiquitin-like 1-activating enzyme E1 A
MNLQEENRPSSNMSGLSLNGSGDQMEVEGTATSTAAPDRFRATNLYDRQIRLWGWEAQQRLMKSRLLMYGMNGVGAEVVKNLMLGGIRQMTIVDAAIVHQNDLSSNFFVRREDFGLNRASASAVRAQLLNPTCLLTAVEGDSTILTEDLVNEYDLVALNCVTLKEALRVGSICRKLGIPLFVSQVLGFHAFYVNDLNGLQFEVPSLVVEKTGKLYDVLIDRLID